MNQKIVCDKSTQFDGGSISWWYTLGQPWYELLAHKVLRLK